MQKMNPVVHFELPAGDRKRMGDFYAKVFGWKITMLGAEMNNYVLASTTDTDENGMVKTPGAINGGFWEKSQAKDPADHYPSVVISVDDIKAHEKLIAASGGKILGPIQEIPGIGLYLSFRDTEGNRMGALQPVAR